MAWKGRTVGIGGGFWRGWQLQQFSSYTFRVVTVRRWCIDHTWIDIGKRFATIPKSLQASSNRKKTCQRNVWNTRFDALPLPVQIMWSLFSRNTKAPTITMAFWLAALILIEVSMRCEMFKPKYRNKGIPAGYDWQPVSATAGMVVFVNSGFNS